MGVSNANALGLGEIKINSALNEPLNAEIKLLQVRKLSPLQIQPRMADVDEFALAGLDKSRFLTGVRFQVKVNPDGTGVIYISSDRPVREPFLNFLVELNWPNGRLVREYTLLLDPPVFDPTPVRQTVQPAAALPSPAKGPRSSSPKKEAVDNIRTRAAGNQQIYVDVKDTLWSIALKNKPNPSVSAKQLMIALQRKKSPRFYR
jgi:pilus assembly protein FimV